MLSKTLFLKEGMCTAIDSEFTNFHTYLLSAYYAPGTVNGTGGTVRNKISRVPEPAHLHASETPVYVLVCGFQTTACSERPAHNVIA